MNGMTQHNGPYESRRWRRWAEESWH